MGYSNWINRVPWFLIPVVIVGGVLLYGGVIPTVAGDRHGHTYRRSRFVAVPVSAVALIVWTLVWMVAALFASVESQSLNDWTQPAYVVEPAGLLFAAALLAWASPFVVSAVRRRGWPWWLLATVAVLVAGLWIADLFANPVGCGCG
jgi:hypothetical protein